ncbi:uncharacterized protein [Ranitomeya imitator]|uniref:uncharacterized protein n=1 Tax=Ranitomeya imitator TaxID=111125 RepID=UPI0037E88FED
MLIRIFLYINLSVLCTGIPSDNMDYRAKEKAWLTQLDQTFGASGTGAQQCGDDRWNDKLAMVKDSLLKRSKLWWNRIFLEKYVANRMIPRGLRVRVIPAFPISDEAFIGKWEEASNMCSFTLMQLLIDHNTANIEELDKRIDELQSTIKVECPKEKLQQFDIELDKSLDSLAKKIQENQLSKHNRDLKDYQTNRVYLWRKTTLTRAPSNTSISSASGLSDASAASGSSRLRDHTYHPYRRHSRHQIEPENVNKRVINLSHHLLSPTDLSLLGRGLSFSPTPEFDRFSVVKDLNLFARSLLLRRYHFNNEINSLFPTEEEQATLRILEELAVEHVHEGGSVALYVAVMDTGGLYYTGSLKNEAWLYKRT